MDQQHIKSKLSETFWVTFLVLAIEALTTGVTL